MSKTREILESTYQLGRIKKVRMLVYSIQAAMAVGLIIMLMVLEGVQLSPLHIPVETFLFVILLTLVTVNIENGFFKRLSVKYAKSDSEKFLTLKDSIKKSFFIIIFAAIIIGLLGAQMATNVLGSTFVQSGSERIPTSPGFSQTDTFEARDGFELTQIRSIDITTDPTITIDVFLVPLSVFDEFGGEHDSIMSKRLNKDEHSGLTETSLTFSEPLPFGEYILVIFNQGDEQVEVSYTIEKEMSNSFMNLVLAMCVAIIIVNIIMIIYMRPLMRLYKKASIYT